MRKFENIIQSETAPDINSLWIKDGELLWFNNGKWSPVCTCSSKGTENNLTSEYTNTEEDKIVTENTNKVNLSN